MTDAEKLQRPKAPELVLPVDIRAQPDETTCGPTCVDSVYRYYPGILTYDANLLVLEPDVSSG